MYIYIHMYIYTCMLLKFNNNEKKTVQNVNCGKLPASYNTSFENLRKNLEIL